MDREGESDDRQRLTRIGAAHVEDDDGEKGEGRTEVDGKGCRRDEEEFRRLKERIFDCPWSFLVSEVFGSSFREIGLLLASFFLPKFLFLITSPYSQSKSLSFILALRSHHCLLSRYQRDDSRTT